MTLNDILPAAASAKPAPQQWREAVAAVRSTLAALDSEDGPVDRDGVERIKAFTQAEQCLFDIPAPDLRGLLFKIELASVHGYSPDREVTKSILQDARALIGHIDLRPFDPARWLESWSDAGGAVMAREDQLFLGFSAPPAGIVDEVRRIDLQRELIEQAGVPALLAHLRRPFGEEAEDA